MGRVLLPAALAGTALGILVEDGGALRGPAVTATAAAGTLALLAGIGLRRAAAVAVGTAVLLAGLAAWRAVGAGLPEGPGSVGALVGSERQPIRGTAIEEPRPRGERQQVVLDDLVIGDGAAKVRGRLLVWLPRGIAIGAGDLLAFDGRLEPPRDFDGFAYREYLARQGIGAVSSAFRVEVSPGSRGAVAAALGGLRAALLNGLNATVPEPEAALGAGILLGVRAGIAPEVGDAFATAGLTHVVAISGWNIAIVAALASAAARPLRRLPAGRLGSVVVAGGAVGGYVLLTGASPSVVRAALMAAALVVARLGGSPAHAASALMVAALAMLLAAPPVLWDVGFQLSALATAGLVWFAAPMERLLERWPAMVREPVALTLAAQLTTLPVILLNFERLSLVAPAANVAVVPLVPVVMLCAALAALAGWIAEALGPSLPVDALVWASGGSAWLYLRAMILAGQLAAAVPFAAVDLALPAWSAAAWYPGLVALHRRVARGEPQRGELPLPGTGGLARPLPAAAATLVLLAALTVASQPDGRVHLVMLDVGQGDAILVRGADGSTALIDGGPDPDLLARRLGEWLPFWQRRIDLLILTHPHEDHLAGLVAALERYRVQAVVEPERDYDNPTYPRFRSLAATERGGRLTAARAGMRLGLGPGTTLTILFPGERDAAAPLPEGDINNASVVALLEHGTFRALLTGDAEGPVEALLLARGLIGPVDVLKVGHHGSESSSTPPLLATARPRLALISAGAGNEYGHPHTDTLAHLVAVPGLAVLRTDLNGSVEIVVDGRARPAQLRVVRHGPGDPGSIGPWPSPPSSARRSCWPRTPCRRESSATRAGSRGSQSRRRTWWPRPASRWTPRSSRPPPCCTTSTSRRPGEPPRTGWSARRG